MSLDIVTESNLIPKRRLFFLNTYNFTNSLNIFFGEILFTYIDTTIKLVIDVKFYTVSGELNLLGPLLRLSSLMIRPCSVSVVSPVRHAAGIYQSTISHLELKPILD